MRISAARTWAVVELPSNTPRVSASTLKKSYWSIRWTASLNAATNSPILSSIVWVSVLMLTVTGLSLAETRSIVTPWSTSDIELVDRLISVATVGSADPKNTFASWAADSVEMSRPKPPSSTCNSPDEPVTSELKTIL